MSETSGEFGIAVGIASLGSLGTFVYRSELADSLPADLPAEAATIARESIAAVMSTAQQLTGSLGTELIEVGRAAFTTGLNVVGAVGAVVFIGLAIVAATVLRRVSTIFPSPFRPPGAARSCRRTVVCC